MIKNRGTVGFQCLNNANVSVTSIEELCVLVSRVPPMQSRSSQRCRVGAAHGTLLEHRRVVRAAAPI